MSVVEARTMTVYVHTLAGTTRRRRAYDKATAYRHAAWHKIRSRCECEPYELDTGAGGTPCRLHDPLHRAATHVGWGGYPSEAEFRAPTIWRVPGSATTYGRAVAFRLARLYRYLDERDSYPGKERSP